MLGYVVTEQGELKVREFELYNGYYCGICKSIGRRFGQLPRMVLSYDAAFLAMVLASLSEGKEAVRREHCIVHPLRKKTVVLDESAVDYAADMMLILAYHKLDDDWRDDRNLLAGAGKVLTKNIYKKLVKNHSDKCIIIKSRLEEQISLEQLDCTGLDQVAEPFAKLMEEIVARDDQPMTAEAERTVRSLGYHLGKWIYLIDALDDLEKDGESGSYNPLLHQFQYDGKESMETFKHRISQRMEFNLLSCLAGLANAYQLLPVRRNQGILENIIYLGLLRKTETILGKNEKEETKADETGGEGEEIKEKNTNAESI